MKRFAFLLIVLCIINISGAVPHKDRTTRSAEDSNDSSGSGDVSASGSAEGSSSVGFSGSTSVSISGDGSILMKFIDVVKNVLSQFFSSISNIILNPFTPVIEILKSIKDGVVASIPGLTWKTTKEADGTIKSSVSIKLGNIPTDILKLPITISRNIGKIVLSALTNGITVPFKIIGIPITIITNILSLIQNVVTKLGPVIIEIFGSVGKANAELLVTIIDNIKGMLGSVVRQVADIQVTIASGGISLAGFGRDRVIAVIKTIFTLVLSFLEGLEKVLKEAKGIFAVDYFLSLPVIGDLYKLVVKAKNGISDFVKMQFIDLRNYILSIINENKEFFGPKIDKSYKIIFSLFSIIQDLAGIQIISSGDQMGSLVLTKGANGETSWTRYGIFADNSPEGAKQVSEFCSTNNQNSGESATEMQPQMPPGMSQPPNQLPTLMPSPSSESDSDDECEDGTGEPGSPNDSECDENGEESQSPGSESGSTSSEGGLNNDASPADGGISMEPAGYSSGGGGGSKSSGGAGGGFNFGGGISFSG